MAKRVRVWMLGTLAALVVAATLSWTGPVTIRITDQDGAPAADAYVQYHYFGSLLNLVHPVSYVARGSVIQRADADGRVTIPTRVHVRRPLPLSGPPHLFIDHVVVPGLHNAFGPIADSTMSMPGVFSIDEQRRNVAVLDVSRDPERWEMSLNYLFDCIRETVSRGGSRKPAARGDTRTIAYARELIDLLRREYAALVARYGTATRQRPAEPQWLSERERQDWRAMIDTQLAREPTWGAFLARKWASTFKELEMIERGQAP